MQRQSWKIVLVVGLGSVLLGGCANFRGMGGGDEDSLSSTSNTGTSTASSDNGDDLAKDDPTNLLKGNKNEQQSFSQKYEGRFALARLCEGRGEVAEAETIYRELLKKEPKDSRVHHRLGVLELQKGNFEWAEKEFGLAKSYSQPTADLLSDIGYCMYLQQRMLEAEKNIRDALKIEPANETATNNLALILGRQGRYQEAKDLFMRNNTEAETCANMGYVMAQNGEYAKAKQMYLRALTLNDNMKIAAKAILQIEERERIQTQLASCDVEMDNDKIMPVSTQTAQAEETISEKSEETVQTVQALAVVEEGRAS